MKRRRYIRDGYDLDLSYITDRVVAMSYPAESLEAMFRNPMWQVQRFLAANHAHHFKWYDPSYFGGRVERFPFDDHGVPALELVRALCESAQDWLDRCHDNIIVVHCKVQTPPRLLPKALPPVPLPRPLPFRPPSLPLFETRRKSKQAPPTPCAWRACVQAGKGRTGVMVCCLLLLAGMTTDDALALYADRRTLNRAGVTIPSQVRYVRYWARLVADAHRNAAPITLPPPTPRTIRRVRLYGMTGLDRVDFVICTLDEADKERYSAAVERCRGTFFPSFPFSHPLHLPLTSIPSTPRPLPPAREQLSLGEVDKPSGRLLRACDSSFCMEVLFAQDCCSQPPPSPAAARPRLTQAGS
ncbi:unnamed protein product [Closterium sp. Yama58-4]|nr:unnamed protein product [Closterium sp. Yama58-4]